MTRRKDGAVGRRGEEASRQRAVWRGSVPAVLAIGALIALAGCTGAPDAQRPSSSSNAATGEDGAQTASDVPQGLESFYSQDLEWSDCDEAECARLEVPIDYANPDDGSIELALLRVAAGKSGQRQGSLVVNPGGPGASGVEYARRAPLVVSPAVSEQYDIVGFDPRGVAESAPISCFDDAQMDAWLGADPSPDTPAEEADSEERSAEFAKACEDSAPELLGHVSTVAAARDMDILRAVLAESELDYLGASYGTFLGATYAELFPERVGRLVLDGAVAPELTSTELSLGQAGGFEQATRSYVEDCIDQGDCPLGDDVDGGMTRLTEFLDELDQRPLEVSGDANTELTEGWALLGIIVAMYSENLWPILTQAMDRALEGDGSTLQFLANLYADRDAEGVYSGNGNQAIYAVNCLDRPETESESDVSEEERLAQFEEVAPTFGRYLAGEGACAFWPVEASETLENYDAEGSAPILVIGTTGDPATPYEWAQILADTLDAGVLLSYDGEGHTAYGRSNNCIDDAVDAYLLKGTVPPDGKEC